jgi:hypothetical protein
LKDWRPDNEQIGVVALAVPTLEKVTSTVLRQGEEQIRNTIEFFPVPFAEPAPVGEPVDGKNTTVILKDIARLGGCQPGTQTLLVHQQTGTVGLQANGHARHLRIDDPTSLLPAFQWQASANSRRAYQSENKSSGA